MFWLPEAAGDTCTPCVVISPKDSRGMWNRCGDTLYQLCTHVQEQKIQYVLSNIPASSSPRQRWNCGKTRRKEVRQFPRE
jgi:hypothetical protein